METSEHILINDDGMQAPLLSQEQNSDDDYQVEPIVEIGMKILWSLWMGFIFLSLDGTPTRYVSEKLFDFSEYL